MAAERHVLLTGDTRRFGNRVTLPDGTEVDVTAPVIEVESPGVAAEIAHQIALGHVAHGHPDDVDFDPKTRKAVQRPFEYDDSHHKSHGVRAGKKG